MIILLEMIVFSLLTLFEALRDIGLYFMTTPNHFIHLEILRGELMKIKSCDTILLLIN